MESLTNEFLKIKKQYDDETDLMQQLEKKPISEGQLTDMLNRGRTDVEASALEKRLRPMLDDLRKRDMIVQDAPTSFADFKKANPNLVCIKASTLQQMEAVEYQTFSALFKKAGTDIFYKMRNVNYDGFRVYQDLPIESPGQGFEKVRHYDYTKNKNEYFVSGRGFMIDNTLHRLNVPKGQINLTMEDQQVFSSAQRLYMDARKEIADIFKDLELTIVPENKRPLSVSV